MNNKDILDLIDLDYMKIIRRQLHEHPELGFDLQFTTQLVKKELDKLNIEHTEEYAKSSVAAYINPHLTDHTIGVRADMDALPVNEINNVEYRSKIAGKMHACGHDGHTAILLGTAKVLSQIKDDINCRIKLIFQPSEEGPKSGAKIMIENGVLDDVDEIIGGHLDNSIDVGSVGVKTGQAMSACTGITIELFGKSGHAAMPHTAIDALAMAVKVYMEIQLVASREIDPFESFIISIGSIKSGSTSNVIADHAEMMITVRTYSKKLDRFIYKRIQDIVKNTAEEVNGRYSIKKEESYPSLFNDIAVSKEIVIAASKVIGEDNVISLDKPKMSSEDFAFYSDKKPGCYIRIGSRNKEKGFVNMPHNSNWDFDEGSLVIGSKVFLQFILDKNIG